MTESRTKLLEGEGAVAGTSVVWPEGYAKYGPVAADGRATVEEMGGIPVEG